MECSPDEHSFGLGCLDEGLLDELNEWRLLQKLSDLSTKAFTLTDAQLKVAIEKLNLGVTICVQSAIDLSNQARRWRRGLTEGEVVGKVLGQLGVEIDSSWEPNADVGVAIAIAKSRDLGWKNDIVIPSAVAVLTPCLSINGLLLACDGLPEALEFGFQRRIVGRRRRWTAAGSVMGRILGTNHKVT